MSVSRSAPGDRLQNVILVGYRGSGKTAVARVLAERLGWQHVDTDACVVAAEGRTIREIFAGRGEEEFRELEARVLAEVVKRSGQVISVGGGAILRAQNRAWLGAAGVCIWLTAPAEVLHARLAADAETAAQRPALTARDALEEVRHLLEHRSPLYAALADHVVPTAGRSIDEVADAVAALLPRDWGAGAE